jgi:P4 family phage/plasmid primase-like protien
VAQTQPLTPTGDPLPMPTPAECWALKAISQKRPIPSSLALRPAFKSVVEQLQGLSDEKQRNHALRLLGLRLTPEAVKAIKAAKIDEPPPVEQPQPVEAATADGAINKPFDEDSIAEELVPRFRGKLAYFWREWWKYDNGHHKHQETEEARLSIRLILRHEYRKRNVKITNRLVSSLEATMREELIVTPTQLKQVEKESMHYLNVQNGLVNLKTGKLEPHRPELYFTAQCDFALDDSVPENWLRLLNTSLVKDDGTPDYQQQMLLQEWVGYFLTGRTEQRKSLWFIGETASGKSTIAETIIQLLGDYAFVTDLNQLGTNKFITAEFPGKRLIVCNEMDDRSVLQSDVYKSLVGSEETMRAEPKGKPAFNFVNRAKLLWVGNDAPRITDNSGATFDRITVIHFKRTIPPEKRDPYLKEKLRAELPGILQFGLDGLHRLDKAGRFTVADASTEWKAKAEFRSDLLRVFLEEKYESDPHSWVTSSSIYAEVKEWYFDNTSAKPPNSQQIKKHWERLGLRESRNAQGVIWYGVRKRATEF